MYDKEEKESIESLSQSIVFLRHRLFNCWGEIARLNALLRTPPTVKNHDPYDWNLNDD